MQAVNHLPIHAANYNGPKGPPVVVANVPLYPPPCECDDCQEHYYTAEEQNVDRLCYTKVISDLGAQQILAKYVESLYDDRQYLQSQCASYGDVIVNRWKKKSRDKGQVCLLQADPYLYPGQWFHPRLITGEMPEDIERRGYCLI